MSTSSASASSSSFSFLSENIFSNYYNNIIDHNNNNSLILRTLLVTGLGGLVAGFFIGRAFSSGGGGSTVSTASRTQGDGDEDAIVNANANANAHATANTNEECKLVLVARTDLGMTKGKIAAQCSHATLACYKALQKSSATSSQQQILQRWERYGQAKVVVQVKSEEELEMLQAQAMSLGLVAKIIHDAGRTQIASGSATVLGVGPGPKSVVDSVTGDLRLL